MAWTDALGEFAPNALVGAGILVAVPIVFPMVRGVLRPAAKGAIKGYLALQDTVAEWTAESGEQLSDLYAEAKSEYAADPTIISGTTEGEESTPKASSVKAKRKSPSSASSTSKSSQE